MMPQFQGGKWIGCPVKMVRTKVIDLEIPYQCGLIAISTLLQTPPLLDVKKTPDVQAKSPEFVMTVGVAHVEAAEFETYMRCVGALFRQLDQIQGREAVDPGNDGGTLPLGRSGGVHDLPNLSTIPSAYFSDCFQLENPRTFDIVSERSEITPATSHETSVTEGPTSSRKALATNSILQEKLSWYMDTAEAHLASSISIASATLFSALGSIQELGIEATESVGQIKTLRQDLATLDENIVAAGMCRLQKRRLQRNLQQIDDATEQLQYILEKVALCKQLVNDGEAESAISEIDSIELLMAGRRSITIRWAERTNLQISIDCQKDCNAPSHHTCSFRVWCSHSPCSITRNTVVARSAPAQLDRASVYGTEGA